MSWPVIILITLTMLTAAAGVALALSDARAGREHAQWMHRNEIQRRRTDAAVSRISSGHAGMGLDGRADRPDAMQKHTQP